MKKIVVVFFANGIDVIVFRSNEDN